MLDLKKKKTKKKQQTAATISLVTTPSLTLSMNHAGASGTHPPFERPRVLRRKPKAKILALIKFTMALKKEKPHSLLLPTDCQEAADRCGNNIKKLF
jgi:hypothetical protein